MSLIKCKKCGEMFSDSYKTCPFCEEDEAYYSGKLRKSRGRRAAESRRRKTPSILGPVAVIVLILLAALVVWLIFGDQIKEAITGDAPAHKPHGYTENQHQIRSYRANRNQIHNRTLQKKTYYDRKKIDNLTLHLRPPVRLPHCCQYCRYSPDCCRQKYCQNCRCQNCLPPAQFRLPDPAYSQ